MASVRNILSALAIVGGAAAATCSVDATTTIQNAGDATGLASCTTFSGSIAIATGTADQIDLSGIQEITGSLTADSARNLPGIISSTLTTIGDAFSLSNLTVLSTLNFPVLTNVKMIDWNGLPGLQQLSFTSGVKMASNLSIQNTQLGALTGINLETVDTVLIANNYYLTAVNMQLGNVSNALTIQANGRNVSAEFPNLIWANFLDINNVSSFSAPSLAYVNTSANFHSDYFTSISGPNVTSIGENLVVVDCPQVTNVSFPQLKSIGAALTVANNTALKSINGFPVLASIGGAVDFTGNFSNASLPAITTIKGAFNVQSQQDITSTCSTFQSLSGSNNVIQGLYYCNGSVANPATGGATTTSSGGSATSSGAANFMPVPAVTGLLGVVAAIFGLL